MRDVELIEVIPVESWRADYWPADCPSRPGWQVRCSVHGFLGEPPGWAYETEARARNALTRHRNAKHAAPGEERLYLFTRDQLITLLMRRYSRFATAETLTDFIIAALEAEDAP